MKVNFVNLDLMFGGGKLNYIEDLALMKNQMNPNTEALSIFILLLRPTQPSSN